MNWWRIAGIAIAAALWLGIISTARADTAAQVLPGSLQQGGPNCPSPSYCWTPYSSTSPMPVATAPYQATPLGYVQFAAVSTLQTLTPPAGARCAVFGIETNAIRWRDDGTAPTATVGQPTAVGQPLTICDVSLAAVQFIPQTGSATVDVSYYK